MTDVTEVVEETQVASTPTEETVIPAAGQTTESAPVPTEEAPAEVVAAEPVEEEKKAPRDERIDNYYKEKAQRQALEARIQQYEQAQVPTEAPNPEDPKYSEDYDGVALRADTLAFGKLVGANEHSQRIALEQQDAERQKAASTFAAASDDYEKDHPGHKALIANTIYSNDLGMAIMHTGDPALASHVASKPDLLSKCNYLSGGALAAELGSIMATMNTKQPKLTTTAPDPVPIVNGGGSVPGKMGRYGNHGATIE